MNVGVIGLGLLGLPFAVGLAHKGNKVRGFDLRRERMQVDWFKEMERGIDDQTFEEMLRTSNIEFCDLESVVKQSEVVWVVVQTPSRGGLDGAKPLYSQLETGTVYDLRPLKSCLADVAAVLRGMDKPYPEIAIISTVLPGTTQKLYDEFFSGIDGIVVAHTPMFCAMGSVLPDLYNPEFIVVGCGYDIPEKTNSVLYGLCTSGETPVRIMSWTDSEIVKTHYNAFITMKINFANTVMQTAQIAGGDCDVVMDTLLLAKHRLISPMYLRGGMGDGCGCHPKENFALASWSKSNGIHTNVFKHNMVIREQHMAWLADFFLTQAVGHGLVSNMWLLGTACKPNINLEESSSAILLFHLLERQICGLDDDEYRRAKIHLHDPFLDSRNKENPWNRPVAGLITCKHGCFRDYRFPPGSIIVDPHRYIHDQVGVKVIRVGGR